MIHKLETYLYHKGFSDAALRRIMLNVLLFAGAALLLGLITLPVSGLGLVFFSGAALFVFNFWFLTLFILSFVPAGYSKQLLFKQLFSFFGRMLITGIIIALLFIHGASAAALVAGFTVCIGIIILTALVKLVPQCGGRN